MCFYQDYDWYASIVEEQTTVATTEAACNECYRKIQRGQTIHTVYQQEHETCQDCENGYCDCHVRFDGDDHECECPNPNFGETFDYVCCHDCHLFLEAVESVEIEAGCHERESRPSYCGMIEDIGRANGDMDEAKRYFKKAAKMFPNLVKSGYLGCLWRKMF